MDPILTVTAMSFFRKLTQDMNVKGRNPKLVFLASLQENET